MEVELIVQVNSKGYKQLHKNKVVTVFSAPNYCYYVGNKGAYAETDELGYLSLWGVCCIAHV